MFIVAGGNRWPGHLITALVITYHDNDTPNCCVFGISVGVA